MDWHHLLSCVVGGAFLANAMPHVVIGTMGRSFQSPIAEPRGEGLSFSTVGVVWGFANLALFYLLVCRDGDFDLRDPAAAFGVGMLAIGLFCDRLFGRHGGNEPQRP